MWGTVLSTSDIMPFTYWERVAERLCGAEEATKGWQERIP